MLTEIRIRPAAREDAFAIARIAFAAGTGSFPSSPDAADRQFRLAVANGNHVVVAESGGVVTGVGILKAGDDGANVEALAIPPRFRSAIVSNALLAALEDRTRELGHECLTITAPANDTLPLRLAGYEIDSEDGTTAVLCKRVA